MPEKILFIDVSRTGAAEWSQKLSSKGYAVTVAHNGKAAVDSVKQNRPDLIVLNTTSPRFNGTRLCATLYQRFDVPIVAIIPRRGAAPLEYADASVPGPPSERRLATLVRRILRVKQPWILRMGDMVLDLKKRIVTRGSRTRKLRPMEARVLRTFMRRPNELVSRADLMKAVWNTDFTGDTRVLDVYVRWVRMRIEDNPSKPKLLVTVRGLGYRLDV